MAEGPVMGAVEIRRWTRDEYQRLADIGLLSPDEHVELVDGEIVEVPPQRSRHAVGIRLAARALRAVFGPDFDVLVQLPLALGPRSQPEPDLAVVLGSPRDNLEEHPETAVLVVEV